MDDNHDILGKIGDLLRIGRIASVDLAGATATVQCGDVLSPDLPWFEWAGEWRSWSPPGDKEQVLLLCPEADIASGIILRGLFSNSARAPASTAEPEFHGPDGLLIRLTRDGIAITAPGDITVDGDVRVTGTITASTDVKAAGVSLKAHRHTGVAAGSAISGAPQ
ncbi:phage baseplate assembly protein V [Altericroceibacterium endophyticum]|uniref:Phage baseplate assembly protein V n=1 Tax=Altericroceibacterium endophyticum TaxID=1808508 RepID=A0A6I4T6G1_9SPHN|nr:phage baseplate assembly protein V [Altericroceibacterium endophyticum]MXO66258.1 phage baseplate assembly protein V [Altericroceibacterium endophyticum]